MKISKISMVIISAIVLLAQFVGKFFSIEKDWYHTLKLPSFTPPDCIFDAVMFLFGINLFLNLLWTYVFFYKHNIRAYPKSK